jgi:hypothetical protein
MEGSAQHRGQLDAKSPFPAAAPGTRPGRLHRHAQDRDSSSKTSRPLSSENWVVVRSHLAPAVDKFHFAPLFGVQKVV